jgi:hypothetical protein
MTVTYPVRVPRSAFRGSAARGKATAARYNEDAARVEAYINAEAKRQGPGDHMIAYDLVAHHLCLERNRVMDILAVVSGCAHTAITIRVPAP